MILSSCNSITRAEKLLWTSGHQRIIWNQNKQIDCHNSKQNCYGYDMINIIKCSIHVDHRYFCRHSYTLVILIKKKLSCSFLFRSFFFIIILKQLFAEWKLSWATIMDWVWLLRVGYILLEYKVFYPTFFNKIFKYTKKMALQTTCISNIQKSKKERNLFVVLKIV